MTTTMNLHSLDPEVMYQFKVICLRQGVSQRVKVMELIRKEVEKNTIGGQNENRLRRGETQ